ncbi:MAG: hypothetical protein DIU78_020670 [Pseudomonadota bacterium]
MIRFLGGTAACRLTKTRYSTGDMVRRGLLGSLLMLALARCGPSNPPSVECGDDPDFLVTIGADTPMLPSDVSVTVHYGGGRETYTLTEPSSPQVLFCEVRSAERTAGAAGAPDEGVSSLVCRLWTEGPATLEVNADGYVPIDEELRLEPGACTTTIGIDLIPEMDSPE